MKDALIRGRYNAVARTIADKATGDVAIDADGAVHIADGGNSITIDGTVTANLGATDNAVLDAIAASLALLDDAVGVAHNDVDSGNPVKVGGKAVDMDGSPPPGAVVQADRADFLTDLYGRQLVDTSHPNFWSAAENHSSAQTNNELVAAPGSGLSLYITDIIVSNGAVAGNIKFLEDTGTPGADKIEVLYFGVNGGTTLHLTTPIKCTANKNFGFTSVSCTSHSVTVCGYTAP